MIEYIIKVQEFNGKLGWRTVIMANETLKFYKNQSVEFIDELACIHDALKTVSKFHKEVENVTGKTKRYVRVEIQ